MDLSSRVNYELLFKLAILDPVTDEPTGLSMMIRSAGSEAAKAVLRKHTNKNLERRIKNKMPKSEQIEAEELEKAASYIASWDWGTDPKSGEANTYGVGADGRKLPPPELSMKAAIEVLEAQGWIFAQVVEAANKTTNFSPSSPTGSGDE